MSVFRIQTNGRKSKYGQLLKRRAYGDRRFRWTKAGDPGRSLITFSYCSFNDAVSSSKHAVSNGWLENNAVVRCVRKQQLRKFKYHPDICLGCCWGKLGKNLSQYSLIWSKFEIWNPSNTSYDRYSLYQRQNRFVATLQYRLMPPSTVPLKRVTPTRTGQLPERVELRHLRLFVIHLHVFNNFGL